MPVNLYCTKGDLSDEGFCTGEPSPAFWDRRIAQASTFIESVTGRWFGPVLRTIRLDGTGRRVLQVPVPIVQIDEIQIIYESVVGSDPTVVLTLDGIRVYNRYLTQGLLEPDDRDAPRLEIESFTGYPGGYLRYFPMGSQNIELTGYFGYTELSPDDTVGETAAGSQVPESKGAVPELIRWVCMKLIARQAPQIGDADAVFEATRGYAITSERTRDQSRSFGGAVSGGGIRSGNITGDPEIDSILMQYRRPIRMAVLGDPRTMGNDRWWA